MYGAVFFFNIYFPLLIKKKKLMCVCILHFKSIIQTTAYKL